MGGPEAIESRGSRLRRARKSLDQYIHSRVNSQLVKDAVSKVDRYEFVPPGSKRLAYEDSTIQLGPRESLSEPLLVALMIDVLDLTGKEKVLEIGTGSGYEAAILSHCAAEVHTIEHNKKLATKARKKLAGLGNVRVHTGDGALGLKDEAPFDAILVTAQARSIPKALVDQLAEGGHIVIPVGPELGISPLVLGLKHRGRLFLVDIFRVVYFHPLISTQDGGWTEEAIEEIDVIQKELIENRKKPVEELVPIATMLYSKIIGEPLEQVGLSSILASLIYSAKKNLQGG